MQDMPPFLAVGKGEKSFRRVASFGILDIAEWWINFKKFLILIPFKIKSNHLPLKLGDF